MCKAIPVACRSTVFSKEQRQEYGQIWSLLEARCVQIFELDEGLEFHFPGDAETFRLLSGWVTLERQCCPFLTFIITVRHEEESISLKLTGTDEAKAYLLSEFQEQLHRIAALSDRLLE